MDPATALFLQQYGGAGAVAVLMGGVIVRLHALLMKAHADRIADRDAAEKRAEEAEARYARGNENRSQELERLANLISGLMKPRGG